MEDNASRAKSFTSSSSSSFSFSRVDFTFPLKKKGRRRRRRRGRRRRRKQMSEQAGEAEQRQQNKSVSTPLWSCAQANTHLLTNFESVPRVRAQLKRTFGTGSFASLITMGSTCFVSTSPSTFSAMACNKTRNEKRETRNEKRETRNENIEGEEKQTNWMGDAWCTSKCRERKRSHEKKQT